MSLSMSAADGDADSCCGGGRPMDGDQRKRRQRRDRWLKRTSLTIQRHREYILDKVHKGIL